MWSSVSIEGKPTVLVADASCNAWGWEAQFCERLFASLKRRNVPLQGDGSVRVQQPGGLLPHLERGPTSNGERFNCLLLFGHSPEADVAPGTGLGDYWTWLNSHAQPSQMLFAACTWDDYDAEVSEEILKSPDTFAPLALAQQSPLTQREAGLFFLKFFTELDLHSSDSVTGRMVWFACSKARELLRRRRLTGKVGLRS